MPRLPRIPRNEKLANAALFAALVLIFLNFWLLHRDIQNSLLAADAPVIFSGPWKPERKSYHPGELIRFTYTRTVKEGEQLLFSVDSFEHQGTHEAYPGQMIARIVHSPETAIIVGVRRLPEGMTPGPYRLEGWVTSQTSRRTQAAPYMSETFEVRAP